MAAASSLQTGESWTDQFAIEQNDLASTGRNPFFVLQPGYQLVFEGAAERLVITVLNEMMPGLPLLGARYVGLGRRLATSCGSFSDVLRVEEMTPMLRRFVGHRQTATT